MTPVEVAAGGTVFLQGEPSTDFFILRSGRVELMRVPGGGPVARENVIARGTSIGAFDAPGTPLGETAALRGEPRHASAIAATDAVLVAVPADDAGISAWIRGDPAAALELLRGILRIVMRYIDRPRLSESLRREAARLHANLAVAHLLLGGRNDSLAARGAEVARALRAAGRPIPAKATAAVLEGDPTTVLPAPPVPPAWADAGLFRLFDRFLSGPPEAWEHLVGDESVVWLFRRLAEGPGAAKERALEQGRLAEQAVLSLLREAVEPFATRARAGQATDLARRFLAALKSFRSDGAEIWGDDLPGLSDGIRRLDAATAAAAPAPAAARAASAPVIRVSNQPIKVLGAVLETVRDPALRASFLRSVAASQQRDEEASKEALRLFWEIYPSVYQAHRAGPRIEYLLFLRYGVAANEPIPSKVAEAAIALDGDPTVPIYHADEWLDRVYAGEFPTSRSELDQSYAEMAAERGGRYAEGEDAAMDLARYEIGEVLRVSARMISGGRPLPCPVLSGAAAVEAMTRRDRPRRLTIADALAPLLEIDFSAFFREVRADLSGKSDFVMREVFPRFIIVPAAGDRAISWQEFEGRAKETPGRILFPFLPAEPLEEMMVDAVAHFRWELARAVAGHEWADPVYGGLSGKYFDYLSFFKKNTEIPAEAKEELMKVWANARTDGDRFAEEYRLWVRHESQGVQKLNRVTRRIFVDHIPFARPLRERLLSHPVFGEIIRKDSNRRLKATQAIEIKEKMMQKAGADPEGIFDDAKRFFEPLPGAAEA